MAFHKITDEEAFAMLRKASQDMNIKLAEVARRSWTTTTRSDRRAAQPDDPWADDLGHLEVHRVGVVPVAAPGEAPLLEDRHHLPVHLADRPALVAGHVEVDRDAPRVQREALGRVVAR